MTQGAVELRDELRRAGLRSTGSRVAVLRLLRISPRPLTHADVEGQLSADGWDRTTLFRNLNDLARVGLAHRSDLGDHVWRFEASRSKAHRADHAHFVCERCGQVQCLAGVEVSVDLTANPTVTTPRSLKMRAVDVQIRGQCDACAD